MDLTPRDIQDRQFNDSFRGYNHEEVDVFLDDVAEGVARQEREVQTLRSRVRELEEHLVQARGTEEMLKRTLLTAQRTAEEAVQEARAKAQEIVAAAERRAHELLADAERRSQELIAGSQVRERDTQMRVDGLKRFEQELRARLQAFLESQLRVLAEGPVGAPAARTPGPPEPVSLQGAAAPPPAGIRPQPPAEDRTGASGPERRILGDEPPSEEAPSVAGTRGPRAAPMGAPQPAPQPVGVSPRKGEMAAAPGTGGEPEPPAGGGPRPRAADGSDRPPPPGGPEGDAGDREPREDRSIRELFWGEE